MIQDSQKGTEVRNMGTAMTEGSKQGHVTALMFVFAPLSLSFLSVFVPRLVLSPIGSTTKHKNKQTHTHTHTHKYKYKYEHHCRILTTTNNNNTNIHSACRTLACDDGVPVYGSLDYDTPRQPQRQRYC